MRTYEVKLYTRKGVYKKTINPKDITSEISFTEDINGGQGQLNLTTVGNVNEFVCSDIIEVREVDETNKEISPTYTGIIESVNVIEHIDKFELSLDILSISTALTDIIYKNENGRLAFEKIGRMGNVAKSIVDYFNSQYGDIEGNPNNVGKQNRKLLYYTNESIIDGTPVVSRNYEYVNCLEALNKLTEDSDYYWFIDATGCLHFKQRGKEKTLTLGRQVMSINRSFNKSDMVNVLYHFRKDDVLLKVQEDGSINVFGIKEQKKDDSGIVDQATQRKTATDYVKKYAYESNEVELSIKPMRTGDLHPGDRLTVNNIRVPIVDKQITQISKARDIWTVKLGEFLFFGKNKT